MADSIRILAMDGGSGLNTAELLNRLELLNRKSFLNDTDVFVGTSAGGINSLFFAHANNPTNALGQIQQFWMDVNRSILSGIQPEVVSQKAATAIQQNPAAPIATPAGQELVGDILRDVAGLAQAAVGCRPFFMNDPLKKFLIEYFGENTTLSQLKRKVAIVTFELDNGMTGMERSWRPRIFTNLPHKPQSAPEIADFRLGDPDEKVVDVALRTSAAPLELPIYQGMAGVGPGFVDGGLVANNPAMIVLSAIVGTLREGVDKAPGVDKIPVVPPTEALQMIHMLSVGTGRNLVGTAQYLAPDFTNGSSPWGYRQWLLDFSNPVVLIDAFLQGANESVAWQCNKLLGAGNFHRLNVPLKFLLVPSDPETAAAVKAAAVWLQTSGWNRPRVTHALVRQTPQ